MREAILCLLLSCLSFLSCAAQGYYSYYVESPGQYSCDHAESIYKGFLKKKSDTAAVPAYELGMCYLDGRFDDYKGTKYKPADALKAKEWFDKAAAAGSYSDNPGYVGYRFLGGGSPSIPIDSEEAKHWLLAAVNRNRDSNAMYNLGLALITGDIKPKDDKAGLEYLESAAASGNARAVAVMSQVYEARGDHQSAQAYKDRVPTLSAAEDAEYRERLAQKSGFDAKMADMRAGWQSNGSIFLNALTQGIAQLSQPNAIEEAKNRGLRQTAEIAAAQQRPHVAAIPQQSPAAATTARIGAGTPSPCSRLAKDCLDSQPTATSPASPTPTSTPMAAVRNAPIVPDPIYAATPASGVCPPSGYYMSQTGDVSVGIPCSPGKPLPASGSQGSAPPSTGGSGNAGQSGTNGNPHHLISPRGDLQQCVTFDFNGQTSLRGQLGWDRYSNTCQQAVNVTVVFQDGRGGASEMDIDAGKTGGLAKNRKEYADHGGSSYYVCPAGYGAADVQGNYLYKTRVTQYMCRQHGW